MGSWISRPEIEPALNDFISYAPQSIGYAVGISLVSLVVWLLAGIAQTYRDTQQESVCSYKRYTPERTDQLWRTIAINMISNLLNWATIYTVAFLNINVGSASFFAGGLGAIAQIYWGPELPVSDMTQPVTKTPTPEPLAPDIVQTFVDGGFRHMSIKCKNQYQAMQLRMTTLSLLLEWDNWDAKESRRTKAVITASGIGTVRYGVQGTVPYTIDFYW